MREEHSRLMKGSIQEVRVLKDPWLRAVGARAAGHGPAGSRRVPPLLRPWHLALSLQICRSSPREVPGHSKEQVTSSACLRD